MPKVASKPVAKKTKETSKHVLLVEDDPFLYKMLSQRLRNEGVDVEVATDGEAAIVKAHAQIPSLMLLDLILPMKSGFEVLAQLRQEVEFKKMPVIVLSNLGQQEDIAQMERLGIRDYLVKADFSLSEIVKKVLEHLTAI